jgi:hypothetical protein
MVFWRETGTKDDEEEVEARDGACSMETAMAREVGGRRSRGCLAEECGSTRRRYVIGADDKEEWASGTCRCRRLAALFGGDGNGYGGPSSETGDAKVTRLRGRAAGAHYNRSPLWLILGDGGLRVARQGKAGQGCSSGLVDAGSGWLRHGKRRGKQRSARVAATRQRQRRLRGQRSGKQGKERAGVCYVCYVCCGGRPTVGQDKELVSERRWRAMSALGWLVQRTGNRGAARAQAIEPSICV